MMTENSALQDLSNGVGMTSRGDVLVGIVDMILATSVGVVSVKSDRMIGE
jgi:hypothetical protein